MTAATMGRRVDAPVRRGRPQPPGLRVSVLAVAGPALVLAVGGWQRRWLSDDGLIAVRSVRQILAGNGPVFNVGERAEANTSTAWQWLLALVASVTQADVARTAVYLGLVCAVIGLLFAAEGTRRLLQPHYSGLVLPAGALVVAALPPFWDFATSGLETGLVTCWIGLAWLLLVRARDPNVSRRSSFLTAVAFGLGPMVRPDLGLAAAVFFVVLLVQTRPGWRGALRFAGTALAVPVGYEIFRAGYYGMLVPLPAVAKEASGSDWARGWTYVGDFVGPYVLLWPLDLLALAVLVVALRLWHGHALTLCLAPVLTGLLQAGYVVRVGGDFMHARMLLPALLCLLLPVLVLPLRIWSGILVAGVASGRSSPLRSTGSPTQDRLDRRASRTNAASMCSPYTTTIRSTSGPTSSVHRWQLPYRRWYAAASGCSSTHQDPRASHR